MVLTAGKMALVAALKRAYKPGQKVEVRLEAGNEARQKFETILLPLFPAAQILDYDIGVGKKWGK